MVVRLATIGGEVQREALSGFFPHTVTILAYVGTQDEYGEVVNTWGKLLGHCDLPCLIAPFDATALRLKAQEFRTSQTVYEVERRRVLLKGYHPDIDQQHRARLEERDWAIISVVHDATLTYTELAVQVIEPGAI